MVHVFSLRTRQHGDGVTTVVFVEAARWHAAYSSHHAWGKHAGHGVVVLKEAWVELGVKISGVEFGRFRVDIGTIFKVLRLIQGLDCIDSKIEKGTSNLCWIDDTHRSWLKLGRIRGMTNEVQPP